MLLLFFANANTFPLTKVKKVLVKRVLFTLERLTMKNAIRMIKLSDKKQDLVLVKLA